MTNRTEAYLDMSPEQFKAFVALPIDGPLLMLNLLKFKERVEEAEMSGAKMYKEYMKAANPFFIKSKAIIRFLGKPNFTLIGPSEEELWDKILIVEYAKKEDFLNMVTTKGYPADIRQKALVDSRLIFCEP